jgi:hypothetical protein
VLHLFNGQVISYPLEPNQNLPIFIGMLEQAPDRREVKRMTLHSDRGW